MEPGQPYLSVVVTARNDDHGGNLLGRMQLFVSGWIEQARRYRLPSELIIVEWNPPAGRPPLQEALRWPSDLGCCEVRFIEVPPGLHQRYRHAEALPLYQMIAKNVGIRRARGRFILATNIDILFSDELMAFLAERRLETGKMYRIDRHDVMSDVPPGGTIEEQLAYCRTHLLRVNAREGTFPVTPEGERTLAREDIAAADSGIRFGRGWFPVERYSDQEIFRWVDNDAEIDVTVPQQGPAVLRFDLEPGPGMGQRPMQLEIFDGPQKMATATIDRRSDVSIPLPSGQERRRVRLYVSGGGDPVAYDPRILNFRVFCCAWGDAPRAAQPPVTPAPASRNLAFLWKGLQHLVALLATGGPLVTITIPVSRRVKRAAAFYVEWGGITGMAGNSVRYLLGRPRRRRNLAPEPVRASVAAATPPAKTPVYLHTNGCGDFTLAAREHWFDLRGYPEFDLFSMNIDSVFCYTAHHGGAVEEVLPEPMRIYHIEHGTGSGWTPEGQAQLFARIAAKGLTFVSYEDVAGWAAQMRRLGCTMIFNHENWGLADFALPEQHPRPEAPDASHPLVRCAEPE